MRANRLSLEVLEDRLAMNCTVMLAPADHLIITGDSAPDKVTLQDNGAGTITGTATGFGPFTVTNIHTITVNTGAGNDIVTYDLTGPFLSGQQRTLDVHLDTTATGSIAAGDDTFQARVFGSLKDKSLLAINVDGGGGRDYLTVDASSLAVAAGAALKTNVMGGTGNDVLIQLFKGLNQGTVDMRTFGGDGDDTVRQLMTEAAGSTGKMGGLVRGDAGNDTLGLFMSLPAGQVPSFALLDGGAGTDTANATANVAVINVP